MTQENSKGEFAIVLSILTILLVGIVCFVQSVENKTLKMRVQYLENRVNTHSKAINDVIN